MAKDLPPFFGINTGRDSIKIAQIKRNDNNKAKIEAIGSVPSSISLVSDESEDGLKQLAEEINKCAKVAGVTTKNCVMSIPELSVFSRLLTLPKVSDEELEESIHYALKPLIPVPIENVNISFLQVDETKTTNGDMINWYTVAAPKNLIEKNVKICELAGLNLLAIETESLGIVRMVDFCHDIPDGKSIMIIDMGAENTNMILARNSVVIFSQTISTGSNSMTKVIASDFGIDELQAERYKVSYGLDFTAGDGKIAKSIEPIVQVILGEASRTLAYLREKIGGESVSAIFLTGGGSGLKGLDVYIKEKLNVDTMIVNPLNNMQIDSKLMSKLQTNSGREFNVAIGLALKDY